MLSVGPSLGAALSTRPVFATPRRLQRIVPYSFNHFQSLSLGTSTLSSLLSRILIIIAVLLLARQLLPLALFSAVSPIPTVFKVFLYRIAEELALRQSPV